MQRTPFADGWKVRPRANMFAELFMAGAEPWVEVTLPHDAMIGGTRSPGGNQALGYFAEGEWEYEKSFAAPVEWRGKSVVLEFEAVYRSAVVWVNGTMVGHRPFGYSNFAVSIGAHLHYGEANVVRVECTARDDARWYSGAGLHRPVHLLVADPVHVALDGVHVTTPTVDEHSALVHVATTVENHATVTTSTMLTTELHDGTGAVVARDVAPLTMFPGRTETLRQRIHLVDPRRWNLEAPHLYTCRTTLESDGRVLDTSSTTFGVRTLSADPVQGLRVNGEPVKLRGACVHHDNGVIGARAIARADERRVALLKSAGFNALRSAHNPMSRSMIDACDRLGMLVMDETFDIWTHAKMNNDYSRHFADWWEADVDAMVTKDRNHPSVILYSIGNEIPETGTPSGAAIGRAITERIRAADSTRPVTNAINPLLACSDTLLAPLLSAQASPEAASTASADDGTGADPDELGINTMMTMFEQYLPVLLQQEVVGEQTAEAYSYLDVAGYNYAESRYAIDGGLFPQRVVLGTENRPPFVAQGWKLVREMPHVIGDFTWVGWDYLGEAGIGRISYDPPATGAGGFELMGPYPSLTAYSGDLDITGFRRPVSYWREIVYGLATGPVLAVQPPEHHGRSPQYKSGWALSDAIASWTWPTHEGQPVTVEVYADADEVELLVNRESIGREPAGADHEFRTVFETVYAPGELVAVAYRDSAEIGRTTLATATGAVSVYVEADRDEIRADDTDLSYVTITLVDDHGTTWTSTDRAVTVSVDGPAELLGLGSANPCTKETFAASTHDTFQGRALAVVRPTGAGTITVTVAAPDCDDQAVTVEAR
jgi:beta-galactosidase